MYYRNAQAALVVYDLTKPTSLIKAKHWVAELQRQASPGIVIALVGNKLDLTVSGGAEGVGAAGSSAADETEDADGATDGAEAEADEGAEAGDARKVSTKEARDYAEEESLLFFETSAKDGTGVQEVFAAIANAIPETQLKGAKGPGAAGGQPAGASGRVNLDENLGRQQKQGDCAC